MPGRLSEERRLTLLVIITASVLWFSASHARPAEKIRLAYPAVAPGLAPSWVTADAGIWAVIARGGEKRHR